MWLHTALCWLGMLSLLMVCTAMNDDGEQNPWRHVDELWRPHSAGYQLLPGFQFAQPGSPEGSSSHASPATAQHSVAQALSPWALPYQRPPGPASDPFVFTENEKGERVATLVKPFYMQDGREYGPYTIGLDKFQNKPYPPDVSLLRYTYTFGRMDPTDFELPDLVRANRMLNGVIYRPHPEVLKRIQSEVNWALGQSGWTPERVDPQDAGSAMEGEFLWPPVIHKKSDMLLMETKTRRSFNNAVEQAIRNHATGWKPFAWTLYFPNFESGYTRKILMIPAGSEYTQVSNHAPTTKFFLFYEAVIDDRNDMRRRFSLLGGAFLPTSAPDALTAAKVAFPASQNIVRYLEDYV